MIDRSSRTEELFAKAREIEDPQERLRFLDTQCKNDPSLRAELDSLLAHDVTKGSTLDISEFAVPMPDPQIDRIGPYQIIEPLGRGGMGVVYLAEQAQPRRLVALKISRHGLLSPSSIRRFEFEVAVLGRLHHPGIAQIYEASTFDLGHGPEPYFAMELVEGSTLIDYICEEELKTQARVELFIKICDAVHHAHQRGVIHRDLKPNNILVDQEGQPKVLDFGIAKATDPGFQQGTTNTALGQIVGTPAYMSPEQAGGDPADLDTTSDVYSLGIVFYEALAGRLPYDVENKPPLEASRIIREVEPAALNPNLRARIDDLETILLTAIDKERKKRYQSASAFAADLRRYLADEPIAAKPSSAWHHFKKFTKRNKALVGGVSATIGAIVIGLAVSLSLVVRLNHEFANTAAQAQILEDYVRAGELIEESDRLWPLRPRMNSRLMDWIDDARRLRGSVEGHERFLAREKLDGGVLWDTRNEQLETIRQLQATGLLKEIEWRAEEVLVIYENTIASHEDDWRRAIGDIQSLDIYDGLTLSPQSGLVPLGRNEKSGFWEFWHWESGDQPERNSKTGEWEIGDESGMVFVLLPGGEFLMGCQGESKDDPNFDPFPIKHQSVDRVQLDPFFISKYEVTQGQWLNVKDSNPAHIRSESSKFTCEIRPYAHPVEYVEWSTCAEFVLRVGCDLPTEAQWEYAARAGTSTPWPSGASPESLVKFANLADRSFGTSGHSRFEKWDDGWVMHAPVGSFEPNAFGLFDTIGNVSEWCREPFYGQGVNRFDATPGEGLRVVTGDTFTMREPCVRGGGFGELAEMAKACRRSYGVGGPINTCGLRPIIRIAQPPPDEFGWKN